MMGENAGDAPAPAKPNDGLTAGLPDKPILTVDDVARFLMLPRSTAYKACKDGTIPCVRFGRHIRISRVRFIEWFTQKSELQR